MSLGLIADDQGRRHHLPAPIHHLIRTLTEKQNKKETTISVDANLSYDVTSTSCVMGSVPVPVDLINAA